MLITYDDGTRAESVQELILMLTPTKTPIYSGAKKRRARATYHEWLEDTITVASDNAIPEGADFGASATGVASRLANITQIFEKVYIVSRTEKWVKQYGVSDQFIYQQQKAMKGIGTDVELALLRGSMASGNGAGASARRMAGLYNYITTLASTVVSGTKLTESLFNDALEAMVNQTDGSGMDQELECFLPARLKRVVSAYTAGNTKNVNSFDKRLVSPVDIYESDFGIVKLFYHRYALSTANSDATALFVNMANIAVATGEEMHVLPSEEVAQTAHAKKGVISGELTLEVHGESQMNQLVGLDTAFN